MKVEEWLEASAISFERSGIPTARLDCLVLLEDVLGQDRSRLLAHPETVLTQTQQKTLARYAERRANHEPLAYIRGKTEFYGREFYINGDVLEPRPESETMIDLLKQLPTRGREVIADIGTGSGALAITAKLEMPEAEVTATDIDSKCLAIAKKNAKNQGAEISFYQGDLLTPVVNSPTALLCNLPYVPDDHTLNDSALHEPKMAIFGGKDGLDLYRKLFAQITGNKQPEFERPKFILTEALPFQHEELTKVAKASDYRLAKADDFIQLFETTLGD